MKQFQHLLKAPLLIPDPIDAHGSYHRLNVDINYIAHASRNNLIPAYHKNIPCILILF
jgi:hypothetical protein